MNIDSRKEECPECPDRSWWNIETAAKIAVAVGFMFLVGFVLNLAEPNSIKFGPVNLDAGDKFGSLLAGTVGIMWSLAGVLFFYSALRLQREDLKQQKELLELQRQESQAQTAAFNAQVEEMKLNQETIDQQRFEMTFFQNISILKEAVSELKPHGGSLDLLHRQFVRAVVNHNEGKFPSDLRRVQSDFDFMDKESFYVMARQSSIKKVSNANRFVRALDSTTRMIEEYGKNRDIYYGVVAALINSYAAAVLAYLAIVDEKYMELIKSELSISGFNKNVLLDDIHVNYLDGYELWGTTLKNTNILVNGSDEN